MFHTSFRVAELLLLAVLVGLPQSAFAVRVIFNPGVGQTLIADGGPMDLDGMANNSITFKSADPNKGFALNQGFMVMGKVTLGGGDVLVGVNADIVRLTDFTIVRPQGALGGTLPIEFDHTFGAEPAGMGAFGEKGKLTASPLPVVGAGEMAGLQGFFANDQQFPASAMGPTVTCVGPGVSPLECNRAAGRFNIAATPNGLFLAGVLNITLPVTGDGAEFANSAEVGFSSSLLEFAPGIQVVPEPSTWLLIATGLVGLVGYGWRQSKESSVIPSLTANGYPSGWPFLFCQQEKGVRLGLFR